MKHLIFIAIILISFIFLTEIPADDMDGWWGGPFGGYCRGAGWGRYGARKQVRTEQEARKLVQEYYPNEYVKVGKVTDRQYFFKVDINNKNDSLIGVVIVDKRTSRIRSID